ICQTQRNEINCATVIAAWNVNRWNWYPFWFVLNSLWSTIIWKLNNNELRQCPIKWAFIR
ncbi:MAG: hypothetical protein ACK53Y_27665, partial [bacterium]